MNDGKNRIRQAKRAGIIAATLLLAVGTIHLWKGHSRFCIVSYSLSTALFVLAGFFTSFFLKITHTIGSLITQLLLAAIFYLVFTPMGLIMRLFGRDPLDKKIDKTKVSYWENKEAVMEDVSRYEKQF